MKYKPRQIEISKDCPFRYDALNLQHSAEALTDLLASGEGSAVIAVDAPWGLGKSTFLEMWAKSFEDSGGQIVRWNAWENDFSDEVFVSLFEEIGAQIDTQAGKGAAAFKLARKAARSLLKTAVPFAVRIGTAGILSGKELDEKGLDKLLEKTSSEYLNAYLERKESVREFRSQLEKFIKSRDQEKQGNDLPVVIIVDELDRCRPAFSLEALETIKHLFGIENLVFVLGVDLEQLGKAIQGEYSVHFNGEGYLRRLIDVRLALPNPDISEFVDNLVDRYEIRESLSKSTRNWLSSPGNIATSLKHFSALLRLSLRDTEQAVFQMNLYLGASPGQSLLLPCVAAFLIALRQKDSARYAEFFKNSRDFEKAWTIVTSLESFDDLDRDFKYFLEFECRVLIGGFDLLEERVQELTELGQKNELDQDGRRALDLGRHFLKMIGDFHTVGPTVDYVRGRIELFEGLS